MWKEENKAGWLRVSFGESEGATEKVRGNRAIISGHVYRDSGAIGGFGAEVYRLVVLGEDDETGMFEYMEYRLMESISGEMVEGEESRFGIWLVEAWDVYVGGPFGEQGEYDVEVKFTELKTREDFRSINYGEK